MLKDNQTFIIEDYDKKPPFSSFLPGISGESGIPLWCFYVNRGQAVSCFGVGDKDHSITEFFPAHQAYQLTASQGFRTFIRKDGHYREAFHGNSEKTMKIDRNMLTLEDENKEQGFHTEVSYTVLPGERVGALLRKLVLTNTGTGSAAFEVLDGLPAVIPYGVELQSMKNMGQTTKAWMQVEHLESKVPYARVRVSMEDTAQVVRVTGGSFAAAFDGNGEQLTPVVDTGVVFGYDTALETAQGMLRHSLSELLKQAQVCQNQIPCFFFGASKYLEPGRSLAIYQIVGQVEERDHLDRLLDHCSGPSWFEMKMDQAQQLTEELCQAIETRTADPVFDAYCKQTYLDNVMRGGVPVFLGEGERCKAFYLYSRKHGDLERDYNFFRMSPEYYSQGNGNFRDVNQNRRSDIFFAPGLGSETVRQFYSLIQSDGYNPLVVEKITYHVSEEHLDSLVTLVKSSCREDFCQMLSGDFTPGQLAMASEDWELADGVNAGSLLHRVIQEAQSEVNASMTEGYWSDHWTYNLDLVERYLAIYPDNESFLLFQDYSYPWFDSRVMILPRCQRYVKTEQGIRQYHFLEAAEAAGDGKWMKTHTGEKAVSSLIEKMILLCSIKFAALDPLGMGVEMEGGKPGWYDALNGLPGLLGSSVAETCELSRMMGFVIRKLRRYQPVISLYREMAELLEALTTAVIRHPQGFEPSLLLWDSVNMIKEEYRSKTADGVSGVRVELAAENLAGSLETLLELVQAGIARASEYHQGICATYFTYEVTGYRETEAGIFIQSVREHVMPLFLEGVVRWLKLQQSDTRKKEVYGMVRNSGLYDRPLGMYKVNASLKECSFEIGRAKAFTPGWLENESVWLHMEYKYLLELLKSGMYREFAGDFHRAGVPFLDPSVYGRSTLENSSFIASSSNPNPAIHGRGFVARLSGATAEFLQMWQIMMFGSTPFQMTGGSLSLCFAPFIPSYLMPETGRIQAVFLGRVAVTYQAPGKQELVPGEYHVQGYHLSFADGTTKAVSRGCLDKEQAKAVRCGEVVSITVDIV